MHGARTVCCSASSTQSSRVAQRCFAGSWNHPSTAFDRNQSRGTQLDLRVKRSVQSKSMQIDYVKLPLSVSECVHGAMQYTGIPFREYSLTRSVPGIHSVSRMKCLL